MTQATTTPQDATGLKALEVERRRLESSIIAGDKVLRHLSEQHEAISHKITETSDRLREAETRLTELLRLLASRQRTK